MPQELLAVISRVMPSKCRVVLEVPRHPSLSSFSNRVFPEMASRHMYPPDHLHIFTENSLSLMLKECNLCIENIWVFGQDFYEVITSMAALGRCEKSSIFDKILESANSVQEAIDRNNLSDIMIVICKKIKRGP
jgi:hypothetical protein